MEPHPHFQNSAAGPMPTSTPGFDPVAGLTSSMHTLNINGGRPYGAPPFPGPPGFNFGHPFMARPPNPNNFLMGPQHYRPFGPRQSPIPGWMPGPRHPTLNYPPCPPPLSGELLRFHRPPLPPGPVMPNALGPGLFGPVVPPPPPGGPFSVNQCSPNTQDVFTLEPGDILHLPCGNGHHWRIHMLGPNNTGNPGATILATYDGLNIPNSRGMEEFPMPFPTAPMERGSQDCLFPPLLPPLCGDELGNGDEANWKQARRFRQKKRQARRLQEKSEPRRPKESSADSIPDLNNELDEAVDLSKPKKNDDEQEEDATNNSTTTGSRDDGATPSQKEDATNNSTTTGSRDDGTTSRSEEDATNNSTTTGSRDDGATPPRPPFRSPSFFCKLCKSNKEAASFYRSHNLVDKDGIVVCPVLRTHVCPSCGATGDTAHTFKYCPETGEVGKFLRDRSKNPYRITKTSTGGFSLAKF